MSAIGLSEEAGDEVMFALGNPVRRDILKLLTRGEMKAGNIAEKFEVSRPAISKHLRILHQAHLVSQKPEGREIFYQLDQAGFRDGKAWLDQFWPDALARLKIVAENTYRQT